MNDCDGTRTAEILLVEDSRGDARLIEEALKVQDLDFNLHVVVDGEEALSFLRRDGLYSAVPRPDIVILDLNLPRRNGRSVLKEIKTNEQFPEIRRTPVIVLTTSNHEEDITDCYDNHANSYVVKPMNIGAYDEIVHQINKYWFSTVELPPHADG